MQSESPAHLRIRRHLAGGLACVAMLVGLAAPAPAANDWPAIDPAHQKLTSETLDGVPAVVLYRKAYLRFRDYPTEANSQLDVEVRVKILTAEGAESFGNVEVPHSRWVRLDDFEGRTVATDGRVVPLGADQVFEEQRSRRGKEFVTKAAFPAVEPGALVDYRYTLYWDDLFYLEPWYFQLDVPVVLSEITYFLPDRYAAQPWGIQTTSRPLESELTSVPKGKELRLWMQNAPKLPDEPLSPPDEALSSRFMMVPKTIHVSGQVISLMEHWESVSELFLDNNYKDFHRRDSDAKKKAKELTEGLSGNREKAEALFRFVRDEVRYAPGWGVWTGATTANATLEEGLATAAGTALLLQILLDTAGVDSDLVWAAHRDRGVVDLDVANPAWFDGVFLRVDVGDGPVFLDATDPGLAFGQLIPGFEGMPAVTLKARNPERLELPTSDPAASRREAKLEMAVDEEGRLAGSGSLVYEGQWAWSVIDGVGDAEAEAKAWEERLEKDYPTLDAGAVVVTEDADASRVTVAWTFAQRDEEVLGDEISFVPAAILATTQPFESPNRLTPVQLDMHRNDVVDIELTWPPGWELETLPPPADMSTPFGSYWVQVEKDAAARKLTYRREFSRPAGEIRGESFYRILRELHDVAARGDAATLSLYLP